MAVSGCLLLFLLPEGVSSQQTAEEHTLLSKLEIYAEAQFDSVTMFGVIDAHINNTTGGESEHRMELGMDREEVVRFLVKQFHNNFTGIPYQEMATEGIVSLMENNDPERAAVGFIIVQIEVRPINIELEGIRKYFLYHITLKSGNFASYIIWENSIVTVCSEQYSKIRLQGDLRHLMDELAINFFKSRGEL